MLLWLLWAENIFSVFFSKYLFRIENVLSQNILKFFLETTLVHVSCYPDHYEPKIFFSIFKVCNYPSIYDFGLEVSPWKCNLRRQASPLQLELGSGSSRYRRYVSRMTWIENCLSQNFSKFFWKPLFSTIHATLFIISRKYSFGFFLEISFSDRKCSKSKYFKIFSGNYSCSCFMLPWSLWAENIFFDFRSSQLPFDIRFWTRGFPWKCDLRRQAYTLQLELESGSSRYRRYVSRMTWIENFLSQHFSKFFWKQLFSTIHATLFIISRNFFFKIGKNENFDYKINENCPIIITKIGKK